MVLAQPGLLLEWREVADPTPGRGEGALGCEPDSGRRRSVPALAPRVPIRTEVTHYPLSAANDALADLRAGSLQGAAVLVVPCRLRLHNRSDRANLSVTTLQRCRSNWRRFRRGRLSSLGSIGSPRFVTVTQEQTPWFNRSPSRPGPILIPLDGSDLQHKRCRTPWQSAEDGTFVLLQVIPQVQSSPRPRRKSAAFGGTGPSGERERGPLDT